MEEYCILGAQSLESGPDARYDPGGAGAQYMYKPLLQSFLYTVFILSAESLDCPFFCS